ncbi:hypothetical protein NX059_007297 [Plenodomus lindquistii]|nr:hypothetical protein NX059_007297 [Plenodomus lindquistii]
MDPLSITASIIAILQVTTKVVESLRDAKGASKDCGQFTIEISNIKDLLITLLSQVDESSHEPWHLNVRKLGGKDGVIFQYRVALEQLKDKLVSGHGIKKLATTLLWKYIKNDAERILTKVERLNSLVQIALEMDHLFVFSWV